ncbi:YciI family protein [Amnibacterium flavum]|uniref:Transcription initiation protein n=1 Tax=Amnibacterium flavum TaxID=2173173 RepID=A0A2V1HM88_9MICO|nr:YciI family protein [Amnibacterium flavum]PVZ93733.1 transcription initiation protein [Amnibacterium flavum]
MPRFLTIGYGDEAGYNATPAAVRDAAHAHDARLTREGAITSVLGAPVSVTNKHDRGVTTTPGPFMRADLPVAGFSLIEAESLEDAVAMVSKTPCAVADGVVEVWPLQED